MSWLFANTVVATGLAAVALLLARWRLAPAVIHGLWLFVLLKLVSPPLWTLPIDVAGWWPTSPAPAPAVIDLAALPATPTPPQPAAVAPGWTPYQWLLVVAATGSAVFAAWFAVGLWRGQRRLRQLGPVPDPLRREVAQLAERLGVSVPDLRDDPELGSPYVWAFGRTRLVLPAARLLAAPARGRAAVLAHELAHLRRGDHWVAHVELLLAVLLWWHPLFWFARARLRLWAELACDAWALASVPDATLDYASVLVDAVAHPDSLVPAPTALAVRPAARTDFERRLTMILNENVPCRASRAWWLPFASLGLGLFTAPVLAQGTQEPAPVEIRVNGKPVGALSSEERTALLEQLLRAEQARPQPAPPADEPPAPPAKKMKKRVKPADAPAAGTQPRVFQLDGTTDAATIRKLLHDGLTEAKIEILGDDELKELGLQDDLILLLDDVGNGKGIGDLEPLLKSALQGSKKIIMKELQGDADLRELGLDESLGKLITGALDDVQLPKNLGKLIQDVTAKALADAKVEIRLDGDLQRLGITDELEGALDGLLQGKGDFGLKLQQAIEKAVQKSAGDGEVLEIRIGDEPAATPEAKQPKPKKQAKRAKLQPK